MAFVSLGFVLSHPTAATKRKVDQVDVPTARIPFLWIPEVSKPKQPHEGLKPQHTS